MKITAIKTFLPNFQNRNRGLIKVETDEGIHGWGEAYSVGPDLSVKPIVDYLATWFVGEDPRRIEYLMMKTHQQLRFPPGGAGLAAISGIEHALWDISGKAAGLPVSYLNRLSPHPSRQGGTIHVLNQFHFHTTVFSGIFTSYSTSEVKGSTRVRSPAVSRIHSTNPATSVTFGGQCPSGTGSEALSVR